MRRYPNFKLEKVSIYSVLQVQYTVRQFFINHILIGKEIHELNNSDFALVF